VRAVRLIAARNKQNHPAAHARARGMAVLESLHGVECFVRSMIIDGKTHAEVSSELKRRLPTLSRGLSSRSVRRFCLAHRIQATSRLSDSALDRLIFTSVQRVSY